MRYFFLSCCLICAPMLLAHGERLLPPAPPKVIYLGGMNATWAADHADTLRKQGIEGIVFPGLIADLSNALQESDTPVYSAALVAEIRFSCRRLIKAGITQNYLLLSLEPEETWFADPNKRLGAEQLFSALGRFCTESGLAGIALDSASTSFQYDYRWEGYRWDTHPPEVLRQGARDFARRCLRAAIRTCPTLDILVIADSIEEPLPLWSAFFAGVVESVGAAQDIPVDLLLRDAAQLSDFAAMRSWKQRMEKRLALLLPPDVLPQWRQQGSILLGATPFAQTGARIHSRLTEEAFRLQWIAAKTLSEDLVWIDGGPYGCWPISEREAEGFSQLRQQGWGRCLATPKILPRVEHWTFSCPTDKMRRVGFWEDPSGSQQPAFVFLSKEGTAVFFWAGFSQNIELPTRSTPLDLYRIAHDQVIEYRTTEEGMRLPPSKEPVLIDGLALDVWAMPTALWWASQDPFVQGITQAQVTFGYRNISLLSQSGQLKIAAPPGYGMGNTIFPVHLKAGEEASFERRVRGLFPLGERPVFDLVLSCAGQETIQRSFKSWVLPRLQNAFSLDGPLLQTPVVLEESPGGAFALLAASALGDVGSYALNGETLWTYRFRNRLVTGLHAMKDEAGETSLLVGDHRGRLHFLNCAGEKQDDLSLETPLLEGGVRVMPLLQDEMDVFLAVQENGCVRCIAPNAKACWRLELPLSKVAMAYVTDSPGVLEDLSDIYRMDIKRRFFLAATQGPGKLWCVNAAGRILWRRTALGAVTTPLHIVSRKEDQAPCLVLGSASGTLEAWRCDTGERWFQQTYVSGTQILDIRQMSLEENHGAWLVLTRNTLALLDERFETIWDYALAGGQFLQVAEEGEEIYLLVATREGGLICLDRNGLLRWEEGRATAPLSAAPEIRQLDADRSLEVISSSCDGVLRVIEIGDRRKEIPGWVRDSLKENPSGG